MIALYLLGGALVFFVIAAVLWTAWSDLLNDRDLDE